MSEPASSPALVLIGTPIGNLGDISARALEELRRVDVIACEDTRRTGRLLSHFDIAHEPFIVCNEHTEATAAAEVVTQLERGRRVALVTDAGMPAISDPGRRVVVAATEAGYEVTAIPGPSAVSTALALSGFETGRYCFEGFLPRSGRERAGRLDALARESRTAVLFEAPHRLARTLDDLARVLGEDRPIVVARELTKRYEEVWRGPVGAAAARTGTVEPRGEYVLVVSGTRIPEPTDDDIVGWLRHELAHGASRRDAVDAVVAAQPVAKRRVYDLALTIDGPERAGETGA